MPRLHSRTVQLQRVVITGMGTVNPLGNDVSTSWHALLKGVSGVAPLEGFATDDLPVKFGAQIKGFEPESVLDKKEARRYDLFLAYAMAGAVEAMNDAGWKVPAERADRTGVLIGTGIAGLQTMYDNCEALANRGPRKISPFFVPYAIANMASGIVSMRYGARGPNTCVVTACTTGTHSIGDAYRIVQRGDADVMIAGGVEAPVNRLGVAGFAAMRALSTRNDDPQRASRPFDRGRDGFVVAEAAGVVVLESLAHALARGARIHAEVVGYGMSGDAHHMTAPPEDGIGAQLSMRAALRDAGLAPEHPALVRGADWLLAEEIRVPGDWAVRRPNLVPSGWAFEFDNDNYPDIDDSAEVILALRAASASDPEAQAAAISRATAWIWGMQCKDGGWAAFDADNTRALCRELPFCDFGEVIDPPSADVTAHVLEFLAEAGLASDPRALRARDWLLREQEPGGSWFGRWGANHLYGTGAAVPALVKAGLPRDHTAIRRASAWLERVQNADGGFGEDLRSYQAGAEPGVGASTASQTAWALLALLEAGERGAAVTRAVRWLVEAQRSDGDWHEPEFTGTGFPGDFYIRYHLYRLVFPLMALGRFVGANEKG